MNDSVFRRGCLRFWLFFMHFLSEYWDDDNEGDNDNDSSHFFNFLLGVLSNLRLRVFRVDDGRLISKIQLGKSCRP